MNQRVPFYKHQLDSIEQESIAKSLKSEMLSSGPKCVEVEQQLKVFFNVKNCKLVNSWTNGALATLLAMNIGPGDEVIVPSMTFIATANVVEILGATPIFCDVDSETLLMTLDCVKSLVTPKTKAIILVHLYGQMCDVKSFKDFFGSTEIKLIEDCAHSFESDYKGDKPGTYSNAAIFSFYATKNITCGEGGAIITNDDELYEVIEQTVLHGMTVGASKRHENGAFKVWDMNVLGVKANLPDILASLLPSQISNAMTKLDLRIQKVLNYDTHLDLTDAKIPVRHHKGVHAHHLYPIYIPNGLRNYAIKTFMDEGIGVTINFRPVHEMNYYRNRYNIRNSELKISSDWGSGVISLPLYPNLEESNQNRVIDTLNEKIAPRLRKAAKS